VRAALAEQLPATDIKGVFHRETNFYKVPLDFTKNAGQTPRPTPASAKVNLFTPILPTSGPMKGLIVLNPNNQSDPIFIFVLNLPTATSTLTLDNLNLQLNGVDPNNVFWVIPQGNVVISPTNQLSGNFLGKGRLTIADSSPIQGGRILGFNNLSNIGSGMRALTTTAQPLVVPVLQLHSPEGTTGGASNQPLHRSWIQKATQSTTFNGVFVMGDSPARPIKGNEAESNGGLGNFPRFLEAWSDDITVNERPAKISGGLIQLKRSAFATAPFETVSNPKEVDTLLFFDGQIPPTLSTFDNTSGGYYRYLGGASAQKAPYYMPPDRQWGYDVGLLSQTPDLFSRRFTTPSAGTPSEFYREVSRDDNWVQTLMCGKIVDTTTGNATTAALPTGQRPANCP
jgi:hypothetical protein